MPLHPLLAPMLPVIATLPVLASQQAATPVSETDVVLFSNDRSARMTVPVRIGTSGTFNFLIDTGSQNTVLSTALASKLALPTQRKVKLIGVAGVTEVDTVTLDEIGLGRRSFYSLMAPLLPARDLEAPGILGLDSLQGQRVQIDFRQGTMAIDDAQALGGNRGYDIVVTARRRSGQLIMTDAIIDGIRVSVVLDTGAEYSIGNRALQKAMARRTRNETMVIKSVTGQYITADLGLASNLKLDQMNFGNVVIAYADAPPFKALDLDKKPALFLGMRDLRALDRIAIDFATRRIYFDLPKDAYRN